MSKRTVYLVILSIIILALPLLAHADNNGKCGNNVEWTLDEKGTLTISGTGAIDRSPSVKNTDCKIIVIQEGVTSICSSAFKGFQLVTSISIPASIYRIGDSAFEKCSKLQSVTIPEGVSSIERKTFSECSNLKTVSIPDSVKRIGDHAFYECEKLTSIHIPEGVSSIENGVFSNCTSLKTIKLPSTITSIGPYAFWDCDGLKSITLPKSITTIGEYAFFWCDGIQKITIPNGVKIIEKLAFGSCENLTQISLPRSVEFIGQDAFKGPEGIIKMKLIVVKDSYAHNYAKENKVKFSFQTVAISKCKISIDNQTYTGKAIKPRIVIEYEGKQLKNGTDYTVTLKNNINIGNAKATVKGKGIYKGTVDVTFKILPKGTSLSKLSIGDGVITIQWKSQPNKVNGYQIQYCEREDFSDSKIITINGAKNTKSIISDIDTGNTYYFRIRTFFKVGKANYYSVWSQVESIAIETNNNENAA